jgi:hypothetical protein
MTTDHSVIGKIPDGLGKTLLSDESVERLVEGFEAFHKNWRSALKEGRANWLRTTLTTFKDQCVREERERMQMMPNSVTIRIVANDATDQEAIQKVVTLESISKSSGTALKLITEDAIRALVESKVIQRAINTKDL